jgi:signal transduction histidine kinase
LLINALKFTAHGGSIDVTCEADDRHVAIHVHDTGVGVAQDKLAIIFEPFVQANTSLTRQNDGLGLGLAISRELARAMDGDVTVKSALGTGSTFTLTLPRVHECNDDAAMNRTAHRDAGTTVRQEFPDKKPATRVPKIRVCPTPACGRQP